MYAHNYGKNKHWQILRTPPMSYKPKKRKQKSQKGKRVTAAMLRLECVRQGLPDQIVTSNMTKKQITELLTSGDGNTTAETIIQNNIKLNPFSLKGHKLLAQMLIHKFVPVDCENRDQRQLQLMLAKRLIENEVKAQRTSSSTTTSSSTRVRQPPKKKRKTLRNKDYPNREQELAEKRLRRAKDEQLMDEIKEQHGVL